MPRAGCVCWLQRTDQPGGKNIKFGVGYIHLWVAHEKNSALESYLTSHKKPSIARCLSLYQLLQQAM